MNVDALLALDPGETTALVVPKGAAVKVYAGDVRRSVEDREPERQWIVIPQMSTVIVAWLREGDLRMPYGDGGKWANVLEQAAELPIGESFEMDRFPDLAPLSFRSSLRQTLKVSRKTKGWRYSIEDTTPGCQGGHYRITKRGAIATPVMSVMPSVSRPPSDDPVIRQLEDKAAALEAELKDIQTAIRILRSLTGDRMEHKTA